MLIGRTPELKALVEIVLAVAVVDVGCNDCVEDEPAVDVVTTQSSHPLGSGTEVGLEVISKLPLLMDSREQKTYCVGDQVYGGKGQEIVSVMTTSMSNVVGPSQLRVTKAVQLVSGHIVGEGGSTVVTGSTCPPTVVVTVIVRAGTMSVDIGRSWGKSKMYSPADETAAADEQTALASTVVVGTVS